MKLPDMLTGVDAAYTRPKGIVSGGVSKSLRPMWATHYQAESSVVLRIVLLLMGTLLGTEANAHLRFEECIARDPATKRILYKEQHWIRFNELLPIERLVMYRCPDGTAFARKRVNYHPSAQAPAFEFIDARKGFVEGLRYKQNKAALWFRPPGAAAEKNAVLTAQNLVADAGFNEFIKANWLKLRTGKALPLQFAVPTRLQAYKFNLKQTGESQFAGLPAVTYQLKIAGLLSLIADPIEVTYDKASRRLLRFHGLSNLRDDAGEFDLKAQIDFPLPARVASEEDWQKNASAPLAACRLSL